jgi:pimeloyl-ACP methyl ester carboxylesterase
METRGLAGHTWNMTHMRWVSAGVPGTPGRNRVGSAPVEIETSKGPIEVTVSGPESAPPILFVHGALVSASLWTSLALRLSRTHRCWVPTLPLGSHRRAMRPDADLSPAGVAELVIEIADRLGLDRLTIVANDSGGAVSQLVAARHPERIAMLVLTNCDALEVFPPRAYGYLKLVASRPALAGVMMRAIAALPWLGLAPLTWGSLSPNVTTSDVRAWTEHGARDRGVRDDLAKFMRGASGEVTTAAADALAKHPVPMALVWGDADTFFRRDLAERLAAHVPGAKLQFIPGARTYAMLDAPDEVAAAVRAFLVDTQGSSKRPEIPS